MGIASDASAQELFADPWNPTEAEIGAWAYDPDSLAPAEDWDLALTGPRDADTVRLVYALAADPACPERGFFLLCLDGLVFDAARARSYDADTVRLLIDRADSSGDALLRNHACRGRGCPVPCRR